jgi:hypothetical protein
MRFFTRYFGRFVYARFPKGVRLIHLPGAGLKQAGCGRAASESGSNLKKSFFTCLFNLFLK